MEAAVGLFAERGFASTSTQDIARAVKMTPGVLYWHFESKEHLLAAVLEMLFEQTFQDITQSGKGLDAADPERTLETLIGRVEKIIESSADNMQMIGVVGAEATDTMPRIEEALRRAYRRLADLLEGVLIDANERGLGHSPPLTDTACVAEMFLGFYMGAFLHQRLFRREFPIHRALPVIRRMLLAAVFPGTATRGRSKKAPAKRRAKRR